MKFGRSTIAITLVALLAACTAATDVAVEADDILPLVETDTEHIQVSSAYDNLEIFVLYDDGSNEVVYCTSNDELAEQLALLSALPNVTLVQPNYSYENTIFSVDDPLVLQQWALYNDGSFYMEETKNQYPVYDNPFSTPSAPGQWKMPKSPNQNQPGMMMPQSTTATNSSTIATAGIDLNIATAWELYQANNDVIIALIDSGVDYTHEDLAGHIWVNEAEVAGNGIDDDGNGYIDDIYGWNFYHNSNLIYTGSEDSHGTHGAGTMIATADNGVGISGIIQGDAIKIMPLKALGGSDGSGSTASLIRAIQYAEANGATICNLSLSTTTNDRALYQVMANSSMLFIVAAGNNGVKIGRAHV